MPSFSSSTKLHLYKKNFILYKTTVTLFNIPKRYTKYELLYWDELYNTNKNEKRKNKEMKI
jgi:hypothetical protein